MSQVKPSWRHEGNVSLGEKAKEEEGRRKMAKERRGRFIAGATQEKLKCTFLSCTTYLKI